MALTSYDSILAAISAGNGYEVQYNKQPGFTTAAGSPHTLWWTGGYPVAGGYSGGTTGVNNAQGTNSGAAANPGTYFMGDCNSQTTGAVPVPFTPDFSAAERPYLTGVGSVANVNLSGYIYVVDRIADSGQLTVAAGATGTITPPGASPAWARSADGKGVMMWIESSSSAPGGLSTFTLAYTGVKADGTTSSGTTGTITLATAAHRTFGGNSQPFIQLGAGHVGVAPATFTINTVGVATLTNISLVVGRILAVVPIVSAYQYMERDLVLQTPRMPMLGVGADDTTACIQFLLCPGAAVSPTSISGTLPMVVG